MSTGAPNDQHHLRAGRKVRLVLALVVVAIGGVIATSLDGRHSRPAPPPAHQHGAAHAPAPNLTRTGRVLWGTGFEDGDLSVFKDVRREGSGLHGSDEITTDAARTGTHSLKIVLPPPTSTPASDDVGRYQLVAHMPDGHAGQDRWYGFSIRLGNGWNLGELNSTRADFLEVSGFRYTGTRENGPGPNLSVKTVQGVPGFVAGTNLAGEVGAFDYGRHDLGPVVQGRWMDFVVHVKWSTGADGLHEEWRDGVPMGRYLGATLGVDSPFEYRMGFYEGVDVDQTRTLYVDNDRVGTSYAAVDPSR